MDRSDCITLIEQSTTLIEQSDIKATQFTVSQSHSIDKSKLYIPLHSFVSLDNVLPTEITDLYNPGLFTYHPIILLLHNYNR